MFIIISSRLITIQNSFYTVSQKKTFYGGDDVISITTVFCHTVSKPHIHKYLKVKQCQLNRRTFKSSADV